MDMKSQYSQIDIFRSQVATYAGQIEQRDKEIEKLNRELMEIKSGYE